MQQDSHSVELPLSCIMTLNPRFVFRESQLKLGEVIGQGAFGTVYKAKLNKLDVCVKVRALCAGCVAVVCCQIPPATRLSPFPSLGCRP